MRYNDRMDALNPTAVESIARNVAEAALPEGALLDIRSKPIEDWIGDDAFQVTFIIRHTDLDQLVDDGLARRILHDLQDSLLKHGENRFAYTRWATEQDLERYGDSVFR